MTFLFLPGIKKLNDRKNTSNKKHSSRLSGPATKPTNDIRDLLKLPLIHNQEFSLFQMPQVEKSRKEKGDYRKSCAHYKFCATFHERNKFFARYFLRLRYLTICSIGETQPLQTLFPQT